QHVAFTDDSRHVITYTLARHGWNGTTGLPGDLGRPSIRYSLERNSWDWRPGKQRLSDLVLLAQLITEQQLDATGGLAPVSGETLHNIWQTLSAKYPQDFSLPTRK